MANFGNALQGGIGGALGGASVGGPLGALAGGVLGGLGGLFGGGGSDPQQEEIRKRLLAMSEAGMNPAQAGLSDQRDRQVTYLDQLKALTEGRGPSLAREMLQDSLQRSEASQASVGASSVGRGVGAGAAYRQAGNNMGAMQSQAGGQMAMARAQEQLGALGMYGQNIGATRNADEGMSQYNATQRNLMQEAQRRMQLEALGRANGTITPQPSMGERILGGGAAAYSMFGGR